MRKTFFTLAFISSVFLCHDMISQNAEPLPTSTNEPIVPPSTRYVRKFRSITDTYYGWPNIYSFFLRPLALVSGATGVEVKAIGPGGLKYEFMLTDKFGIGTDINYSLISFSYSKRKNDTTLYTYKVSSPAFRSMISFNFHKGQKKKLDWYSSIKVGYYDRSLKVETNDPKFAPSLDWPLPIAFRMEAGFRYFPTRFTGIHFNMGLLGSALFNVGVSQVF